MLKTLRSLKQTLHKDEIPSAYDSTKLDRAVAEMQSEIEKHSVEKSVLMSKLNLEPTGYPLGDAVIGRRTTRTRIVQTELKL